MWSETVTKTVLENCLRVIVKRSPGARTISLGLFVDQGVKDEDLACNGISHFIEHLVFNPSHMEKATRELLDGLMDRGATYEAFTGKEFTRCTITCRREELRSALAFLADLLRGPKVRREAVEHERAIILEERATWSASGRIQEELVEKALWGERSLGLFVIGRRENIASFEADHLQERLERCYSPDRTQLVILGDVVPDQVSDAVEASFAGWPARLSERRSVLVEEEPNIIALPTEGDRANMVLAFLGASFSNPDRHAMALLGDILGLGIKSRLFQEVREKRQLCYSIYGYTTVYRLGGYLAINFNTGTAQVGDVYKAVMEVVEDLKAHPVSEGELERVKAARITAALELPGDARRHLQTLGRYAMLGRDFFVDWECREVEQVTAADLLRVAQSIFTADRLAVAGIGVSGQQLLSLI